MDSGSTAITRTTATTGADAVPDVTVPAPRSAPPIESIGATLSCRCGHGRDAHEHFRTGSDCSACDCARFRRPRRVVRH